MILDEIVEHKRREVADREAAVPIAELRRQAKRAPTPRPLVLDGQLSLIAELKRRSPSAGDLGNLGDPASLARAYQDGGAAAISVLTDGPYFGGSLEDLRAVRQEVDVPVLCKDFVIGEYQVYEARAAGADLLLLILSALDDEMYLNLQHLTLELGATPLVEVHDQHDLARAIAGDASLIGINNRDLVDFTVDLVTTEYLAPLVPDGVPIVSESGIRTREDVDRVARAGARAVLVGETLMRSAAPAHAIRELMG